MDFISMLPTIFKGVTGIGQLFSGLFGQPDRPTYEPPKAAKDALKVSTNLASQTKLPGQQILETQLGEKTAGMTKSLERMGAGGAGIAGLSSIYAQEANAKRGLAGQAAQYYMGNQGQLRNQLNNYAQYEDKAWQKNIGDKYEEEAAASSALTQAGLQNTSAALGDAAGSYAYSNLMKGGNANVGVTNNTSTGNPAWLQAYLNGLGKGQTNPYYNPYAIKY